MDERDLGGELRQEERFLHRRVAAADDHDLAVAVERGVAGGAVGDAPAVERALRLEPELARGRAGGDDDRPADVLVVADVDLERALGEVDPGDVVGDELGAETGGLSAELGHHLRPHHPVAVAGVVLDLTRDHQLAAPVEPLDHERAQIGARGVQRGRVAGGSAADDDHVTNVVQLLAPSSSPGCMPVTIENESEGRDVPLSEA